MATTGSLDLNLTAISNTINNSTTLASNVMGGVKDQGELVGTAIGITLAVGLFLALVLLVIAFLPRIISTVKGLKRA